MVEKRKIKNDENRGFPKKLFWGCGLSLIIMLIAAGGAVYWFATAFTLGDSIYADGARARSYIEDITDTPLPESATDEHIKYTSWLDWMGYMRFTLPADEVDAWLEAADFCFELPLSSDATPYGAGESLTWWQPENAEVFVGANCGNDPYYRIFVDQTDPATSIIYLVIFTT